MHEEAMKEIAENVKNSAYEIIMASRMSSQFSRTPASVFIKKVVPYAVLLVFNYRIQLDILNAPENVSLNKRICLFQFCDQFLCFKPFA